MGACNLNTNTFKGFLLNYAPRIGGTFDSLSLACNLLPFLPEDLQKLLYFNNKWEQVNHGLNIFNHKLPNKKGSGIPIWGKRKAKEEEEKLAESFKEIGVVNTSEPRLFEGLLGAYHTYRNAHGFTVVHNLPYVYRKPPGILVLDEDITLKHLCPQSAILIEVDHPHGIVEKPEGLLAKKHPIPTYIKKHYSEWVEWYEEAYTVCNVRIKNPKEDFEEILANLPKPPYIELPLEERIAIAEDVLLQVYPWEHYPLLNLFVASLFYLDYWIKATPTERKLFLIANEDILLFKEWFAKIPIIILRSYNKRLGLWFFEQVGDRQVKVIEKDFPYKSNFLVASVDEKEWETFILNLLGGSKYVPSLILTGTMKERDAVENYLKNLKVKNLKVKENLRFKVVTADRNFGVEEVRQARERGKVIIYYENSAISRGVDVNIYDIVLVWSHGFTAPYEEWLAEKTGNAERLQERLTEELEQSVVRNAPVRGSGDERQPKFVVIRGKPPHLKLLADRYIGKLPAAYLAEVILLICPKVESREDKGEFLENWLGQPRLYYGRTLNNIILEYSPDSKNPENPPILLINAVLHANPESVKSLSLKRVNPQLLDEWFTRLLTRLAHRHSAPCRTELEEYLRDLIADDYLRRAFINLLTDLGIFRKVKKGKYTYYLLEPEKGLEMYKPFKCKNVMCEIAEALLAGYFADHKIFVPDKPASYPKQYVDKG